MITVFAIAMTLWALPPEPPVQAPRPVWSERRVPPWQRKRIIRMFL